jgi:hypothetical protein
MTRLPENLLPNPSDEGRLHQHGVEIGKSVYRPLSIPAQIFGLLLEKAARISDPYEYLVIDNVVAEPVKEADRPSVRAMVIEELRRVHEGTLARYGLRQSEFLRWPRRLRAH